MKRLLAVTLAAAVFMLNTEAQTEKTIKTDIKHVTVFPDRAQVDQEAAVGLQPGKNTIKLSALSPYIDAQSVSVKGFGDFTILSVNHRNNYLENLEDSPEVKSIRSQIEALQSRIEDESAALNTLREKEAFLIANRAMLIKETAISVEQAKNVIDLYTSNMDQVMTTRLKKERLIKEYNRQITALQQQISEKLARQQLPSGEIEVTLTSEKQATGKLSFSYIVTNAGWYPSYDIRVEDIKSPVGIFYKANVYQNTGTDWKDVKLSFSNATPAAAGNLPVIYPWFIDFVRPVLLRSMDASRSEAAPAAAMKEASKYKVADELQETAALPVDKQVGETTVIFDVNLPSTIPSDGKIQVVEIQRLTATAGFKYIATPKLFPKAYLTANIEDWAKLSLQTGESTLYFENTFVGKSELNVNQMTDTLAISLGIDNSILVKREKRKDFTSKKVLGSNKTDTFSFLLTIRNNKGNQVELTLNDQIPVSSNSSITVDPVELSGGKLNRQTGEVNWDLQIAPQETKQIVLTYSVKYPKDKIVILE